MSSILTKCTKAISYDDAKQRHFDGFAACKKTGPSRLRPKSSNARTSTPPSSPRFTSGPSASRTSSGWNRPRRSTGSGHQPSPANISGTPTPVKSSTPGSRTASLTSPSTASTAISKPKPATRSPSSGRANRRRRSKRLTYAELHAEVCRFANGLKSLGVKKGDRVAIYMPMIPEAAVALLACARIGAIHSVVFGGFSADSLSGPHQRFHLQTAHHRECLVARRQKHSAQKHRR